MICQCGLLIKKRTVLDGIKALQGQLIVFQINKTEYEEDLYIKECCYSTIIPSLYTFIEKSRLLDSNVIVFDPKTVQVNIDDIQIMGKEILIYTVFKLKRSTFDRILSFGTNLEIIYIDSAKLIAEEYMRAAKSLQSAYQQVIELQQNLNKLKYQYLEKIAFKSNKKVEAIVLQDSIETPAPAVCQSCSDIKAIKDSLKKLKKESYERIHKMQYDLDITNKNLNELKIENNKLKDENTKLKDINDALYMNR